MIDIPVLWQFNYEEGQEEIISSDVNQQAICRVTKMQMTAEWTLCLAWMRLNRSIFPIYEPIFIEIRRNSSAGELLISGTLTLSVPGLGDGYLVHKKFVRLLESDHLSIRLRLQYSPGYFSSYSYILAGHIYIFDPSKKCLIDLADIGTSKEIDSLSDQVLSFPEVNAKYGSIKSLMELSDDFLSSLDQREPSSCDVDLKCGQVSIPAHKTVLSVRSPVFSAMFKSGMKEEQENIVDVPDIDESVLRTFLTYVYSGRTCKLSEPLAADLMFAADKYQLNGLKTVCCSFLKRNMSVSNVVNILILGDLHDPNLKTYALEFMSAKYEEFSYLEKTEEWSKLQKEKPGLVIEVLTSLVKFKERKCKK